MASEKDSSDTGTITPEEISGHQVQPPRSVREHATPSTTRDISPTGSTPPEPPNNTTITAHPTTDPLSPTLWPSHRKTIQLTLCVVITYLTGWNATALTALTTQTNPHFSISDASFPYSVWALTAWTLGAAIAPMFILPVMEDYGTRAGYLSVYVGFLAFVIAQPLIGPGVAGYRVFCGIRFIAGGCAGVLQTCMDGVIADMWEGSTVRMSRPVSCYVGALLAGVSSGPVMGGVLGRGWGWGWRGVLWGQVAVYALGLVPVWWWFGETRVGVLRGREEQRRKKERMGGGSGTGSPIVEESGITAQLQYQPTNGMLSQPNPRPSLHALHPFLTHNILRPFTLLLTEPVVFSFTLLSALSYGITFLSTQSIPQVYTATYAFTESQAAYIQATIVLGELVGWGICLWGQDPFFEKCAKRAEGSERLRRKLPEKRLCGAVPASLFALAAGLFIYGFTARPSISLYVPTLGLFLIGVGVVVVMQAIMMYVTDSYGIYAASASAAVCFGENVFAAFLPLGSQGMYDRLGFGWAGGLLGFVAVGLAVGPVVLLVYGERVRRRSRRMVSNSGMEVG